MCRYGFELVEFLFKKMDTKLVVLGEGDNKHDSERELADDLLAICNYIVARKNGLQRSENRRKRSEKEETMTINPKKPRKMKSNEE